MAHSYKSGRFSRAFAGTGLASNMAELDLESWEVNPVAQQVEFNTSMTGVYSETETTFKSCTFSVQVQQNYLASPYGSTGGNLSLTSGGTCSVELFLNNTAASPTLGTTNAAGTWWFPVAVLLGNPQSVTIEGKAVTRFNFRNSGIWYEPAT